DGHVTGVQTCALPISAATGVFAVAGGRVVQGVLGSGYGAHIGTELGWLVVALAPWMVASVGVAVAFPLVFVQGREARLPLYAVRSEERRVGKGLRLCG